MPDVREKLVELLGSVACKGNEEELGRCPDRKYGRCGEAANLSYCVIQNTANHLIANGVTIPIRCKDCKHWLKDVPGCTDAIRRCRFGNYMVGAAGYCVYGERKDND